MTANGRTQGGSWNNDRLFAGQHKVLAGLCNIKITLLTMMISGIPGHDSKKEASLIVNDVPLRGRA